MRIFCDKPTNTNKTLRNLTKNSPRTGLKASGQPQSGRENKHLTHRKAGNGCANPDSRARKKLSRARKFPSRQPER
ncbi:protein of unknown function [Aminobacter niigataensis]|nr:protein of unknown function [Aminobacter niigataensis]